MSEQTGDTSNNRGRLMWAAVMMTAVIAILLVFVWVTNLSEGSQLKPVRATATPGKLVINNQPLLVTFDQLNGDPFAFLNQRIRVTGDFQVLQLPDCLLYNGPSLNWSLIASELQLDAAGFEPVTRLVPIGTSMTVEGIWRLYYGPLGCGKEPSSNNAWYIEVTQIVQPNPLPIGILADGGGLVATPDVVTTATTVAPAGIVNTPAPGTPATILPGADTPTPTTTGTATATPTVTPTGLATVTATITPAATETRLAGTPAPTETPTSTPTATATPTITLTPTPGPSPTPQPTQPVLPTATSDPSGYPPGNGGDDGGGGGYP